MGRGANSYHKVIVDKNFYFGVFMVTRDQYQRVMEGSAAGANTLFKTGVSWNTLRASSGSAAKVLAGTTFIGILNQKISPDDDPQTGFDLPTESMWEIAARAGNTHKLPSGDVCAASEINAYAWSKENSGGTVPKVGTKPPNAWGIYDYIGGVWDITRDTANSLDLATLQPNALVPIASAGGSQSAASFTMRGSSYDHYFGDFVGADYSWFRYSTRWMDTKSGTWADIGFRLTFIPEK